ncbi:hypothetical protein JW962_02115 [Candidatus Dojkabacteria bacterium]|nr:hypothetical protein [Candidatus Dojkabacteria bacterium]
MIFLTENFAIIALLTWAAIFIVLGFYLRGVFKVTDRNEVFSYFNVFFISLITGVIIGRLSYVLFNIDIFRQFSFSYLPITCYESCTYVRVLPYVLLEFWNGLDVIALIFTFLIVGISVATKKYKLPKVRMAKTLLNISLVYLCFQVASYLFLSNETPTLVVILLSVVFVVYLSGFLLKLLDSPNQTVINYAYFSFLAIVSIMIVVDNIIIGGFKSIVWFIGFILLVIAGIILFVLGTKGKSVSKKPKIEVVMKDWK